MFDTERGTAPPPAAAELTGWRLRLGRLGAVDTERLDEAQCIDLIRELEDLKSAAAGAQAALTAQLAEARKDAEAATGTPARARGKGLSHEVALARRISPTRGGQHLGLATALTEDMPHTLAALRAGHLSEWRATIIVRETICLSRADRQAVDDALFADPDALAGWGDRQLAAEVKKIAYGLDPQHVTARAARAEKHRHVSIRPAPDTMAYVTALLPVAQAVSVFAALTIAADAARARGDDRSRGQVMADTFVARMTGREPSEGVPVAVQLVMPADGLFADSETPGYLMGHGTVPAGWARNLATDALATGAGLWLRRLFTDAADHLAAMDSRARCAPEGLAHFITTREGGICRTPYCDAPVRHIDHVVPHADGGATSADNLQGLCESCNYAKQAAGWRAELAEATGPPGGTSPPAVITTTPTGHLYRSAPSRLPRANAGAHGPRRPEMAETKP